MSDVHSLSVKVCGMMRGEDVALALKLGADRVGFIHHEASPRHLDLEALSTLSEGVDDARKVVVLVEPEVDLVRRILDLGFRTFQLHLRRFSDGLAKVEAYSSLVGHSNLWLAPGVPPGEPFPEWVLPYAGRILVDTYSRDQAGGTGKTGDWETFRKWTRLYGNDRFVLAGGIGPENLLDAVRESGAAHVDVNSAVELAPGIKDEYKLRQLFSLRAQGCKG